MRTVYLFATALVLAACTTPGETQSGKWFVTETVDKMTDAKACRVMYDSEFNRAFNRGLFGQGLVYYFYAENHAGQVRAGITAEPQIPISGDVQLRVDQNSFVPITVADTPVDSGGSYVLPDLSLYPANVRDQVAASMKQVAAMASPIRVLVDDKAKSFLREAVSGQVIRYRVVGVNAYLSSTAELSTQGLAGALARCAIGLQ